jgi:hypothetical protein
MMPYNPPFHGRLIEGAGFTKAKDLVAFDLVLADSPHARLIRLRDGLKSPVARASSCAASPGRR